MRDAILKDTLMTTTNFQGLVIGGQRIASADGRTSAVYNPATGESLPKSPKPLAPM